MGTWPIKSNEIGSLDLLEKLGQINSLLNLKLDGYILRADHGEGQYKGKRNWEVKKDQKLPKTLLVVAQWLRIYLPMQGTWVWFLLQKIPHAIGQLGPCTATTSPCMPRAHALQQEKPPLWKAHTLQQRVALAHSEYRKPLCSNRDPMQPKINNLLKKLNPRSGHT